MKLIDVLPKITKWTRYGDDTHHGFEADADAMVGESEDHIVIIEGEEIIVLDCEGHEWHFDTSNSYMIG